jgi:hypothetical protein
MTARLQLAMRMNGDKAMNRLAMSSRPLLAAVTALCLASSVSSAENKVPNAMEQEVLIKASLLTLNDANLTGNYAVLHAKLSKPFREQFSPERLKQSFKDFADRKTDWEAIVAMPPVPTAKTHIDKSGALILRGFFDAGATHVVYELDFLPSEGEWKASNLTVRLKPAGDKQ